jgi:hypothetical protein
MINSFSSIWLVHISRQPSAEMEREDPLVTDQSTETTASQANDIQEIVLRAATTQVAAMSALVRFWLSWAEAADTYTKGLSAELLQIGSDRTSNETVGRVTDLTREYVRRISDLPVATARNFLAEVESSATAQGGTPKQHNRARAARVKV